jgi:hypothetical protein
VVWLETCKHCNVASSFIYYNKHVYQPYDTLLLIAMTFTRFSWHFYILPNIVPRHIDVPPVGVSSVTSRTKSRTLNTQIMNYIISWQCAVIRQMEESWLERCMI